MNNIIISGSTGSGKTTFLKSLLQSIPQEERLISIENVDELRLSQTHKNTVIANSLQKSFFFVGEPLRYASENKALAKPFFNIANPFYNGLAIVFFIPQEGRGFRL